MEVQINLIFLLKKCACLEPKYLFFSPQVSIWVTLSKVLNVSLAGSWNMCILLSMHIEARGHCCSYVCKHTAWCHNTGSQISHVTGMEYTALSWMTLQEMGPHTLLWQFCNDCTARVLPSLAKSNSISSNNLHDLWLERRGGGLKLLVNLLMLWMWPNTQLDIKHFQGYCKLKLNFIGNMTAPSLHVG